MTERAALTDQKMEIAVSWTLAMLVLVFPVAIGLAVPYLMIILVVPVLILFSLRRKLPIWNWPMKANMLLFFGIGLLFAVNASSFYDPIMVFNFTALLFFVPFYASMVNSGSRGPINIGQLAMLGTIVTFVLAVWDVLIAGNPRAGHGLFLGPNRVAETAAILGFLAIMAVDWQRRLTWIYLVAPIISFVTIMLCGSRGALLAYPPLVLVVLFFLVRQWKFRLIALAGIALASLVVIFADAMFGGSRALSVVSIFGSALSGNAIVDYTTSIRLAMYEAGWQAFLEAPLVGHGWANMMSSVLVHVSPDFHDVVSGLPQLHNDIVDFAVAGGIFGVVAYLALIFIPVVAVFRMNGSDVARYGVLVIALGYLACGLTDLMIGFEFHTGLYIGLSALILGMERVRIGANASVAGTP